MRVPRLLFTAAVVVAAIPSGGRADAAGACHCYRERTFDLERPGAVDPYLLATSRSSLLSAAFGPPKRELVEAVMTGTSPDDLWIAHWAASRTGTPPSRLLEAKKAGGSWKAALAPPGRLGKAFEGALSRGAADGELAALAVDDVLTSRLRVEPAAVAALHEAGASPGEAILAVVLADRLQTKPVTVLASVKGGGATWGQVLQGLGLTPKDIDPLVRRLESR